MSENKTKPTDTGIETFLSSIDEKRQKEAHVLINMMQKITGTKPVMWGPSIIGFGSQHYVYDTGREGDMPMLGFSPRKTSITIYFSEGFDGYNNLLEKIGTYKASVSCLYINKLEDIDLEVLRQMLDISYSTGVDPLSKPTTVDEYVDRVPLAARAQFDELRSLVKKTIPNAKEVLSYGIVGYKIDDKRARVYISGWKDHLAMYPIPKDVTLQTDLAPYIKGKGTLWFPLNEPLPEPLILKTVRSLTK